MAKPKPTLRELVERWIRAEWQFRMGPDKFSSKSQDWYDKASGDLRRHVTGEENWADAAEELGCKLEKPKKKRRKKAAKKRTVKR